MGCHFAIVCQNEKIPKISLWGMVVGSTRTFQQGHRRQQEAGSRRKDKSKVFSHEDTSKHFMKIGQLYQNASNSTTCVFKKTEMETLKNRPGHHKGDSHFCWRKCKIRVPTCQGQCIYFTLCHNIQMRQRVAEWNFYQTTKQSENPDFIFMWLQRIMQLSMYISSLFMGKASPQLYRYPHYIHTLQQNIVRCNFAQF